MRKNVKAIVIHVNSEDGSIVEKTFHDSIEEARKERTKVNSIKEETNIWAYITVEVIE